MNNNHKRDDTPERPDPINGPEVIQPRETEIDIAGDRVWFSIPTADGGPAVISIPKEVRR